jgi:predicted transcriptional regulator
MNTDTLLSKDYVNEVIEDYGEIIHQVDKIIRQTGYKSSFIAKKLGLPESTFYLKKRNKTFTFIEMKRLVELMDDEDDDEIEDAFFAKIHEERKNDPVIENVVDYLKSRR